jgi:hypothetical protein
VSVVTQQTRDDVLTIQAFFWIDGKANRHLFRAAADFNGDAFATCMHAMATAIRGDQRYRCDERIKAAIAAAKAEQC